MKEITYNKVNFLFLFYSIQITRNLKSKNQCKDKQKSSILLILPKKKFFRGYNRFSSPVTFRNLLYY